MKKVSLLNFYNLLLEGGGDLPSGRCVQDLILNFLPCPKSQKKLYLCQLLCCFSIETNLLSVEGAWCCITIIVVFKSLIFKFKVIVAKNNALNVAGFQVLDIDFKGFNE
jgi:hypothetical protein